MSAITSVFSHLQKTGAISIREAMDDYGLSGGHLTKIISRLKRQGHEIVTEMRKHPITGRKYARYYLKAVFTPETKPVVSVSVEEKAEAPAIVVGAKYTYQTVDGMYFPLARKFVGKVCTVQNLDDGGLWPVHVQFKRRKDSYCVSPAELVPYVEPQVLTLPDPEPFKVGDKVKVVGNSNGVLLPNGKSMVTHYFKLGTEGVIQGPKLLSSEGNISVRDGFGMHQWVHPSCLQRVYEPVAPGPLNPFQS